MVLLVLAVLWGIVLIPPALRNRAEARQGRSVRNFRKRLEVLAPPNVPLASRPASAVRPAGSAPPRVALVAEPRLRSKVVPPPPPPAPPPPPPPPPVTAGPLTSRAAVLRRRRQVFGTLAVAAPVSLVLAVAFPDARLVLMAVHLVADAALAGYVVGLRRLRQLARERSAKVRYLPVAVAIPVTRTPASGTAADAPSARSAAL